MRARLDEECVIKANSQFWEQMLAMTLDQTLVAEEFCVAAGHIRGSVDLSGEWKGRIEVRMASGLAYQATAAMMMQPIDTVGEADALDAAREIANMIAGTIKSSLPRPCSMAVPESVVVETFAVVKAAVNSDVLDDTMVSVCPLNWVPLLVVKPAILTV